MVHTKSNINTHGPSVFTRRASMRQFIGMVQVLACDFSFTIHMLLKVFVKSNMISRPVVVAKRTSPKGPFTNDVMHYRGRVNIEELRPLHLDTLCFRGGHVMVHGV